MVEVSMDAASKKLALDAASVEDLDGDELRQAEHAVDMVNRLMADLVQVDANVPPVASTASEKNIKATAKLAVSGVKAVQQRKFSDAIKLLTVALEAVLRRPLWDPTATTLEEVVRILAPRCDAYIASQMWPEAYADASMLLLMAPQDAASYYRKAVTLLNCGRTAQAHQLLVTAVSLAPQQPIFRQTLENVEKQFSGGSAVPGSAAPSVAPPAPSSGIPATPSN